MPHCGAVLLSWSSASHSCVIFRRAIPEGEAGAAAGWLRVSRDCRRLKPFFRRVRATPGMDTTHVGKRA